MPESMPITVPVAEPTVAAEGTLLTHTPPAGESDNVIEEPTQTADAPLIVPATGAGETVTVAVT